MSKLTTINQYDELIQKLFTEGLEKSERETLVAWIQKDATHKHYFEEQQELWYISMCANPKAKQYDWEKAYTHFIQRIDANQHPQRTKLFDYMQLSKIAAIAILVIVVGVFAYWVGQSYASFSLDRLTTIEAPLGSKTKLVLPDGSTVWLNSGSKISYAQSFGHKNRDLALEGEAYFEVTKNKNLPFQLQMNGMRLKVLGTKFNVTDYPEDSITIVNLLSGHVALENQIQKKSIMHLLPNERATFNNRSGKWKKSICEAQESTQWTSDYLLFEDLPLSEIIKTLNRAYDVHITLDSTKIDIANLRFYGKFIQSKNTIEDILTKIVHTKNLKYKGKNGQYYIYFDS
ncbi:MAG TPA: FecR domain-containing protein [Bacteroidaceae bacterium]|nr:FecR domain-containing protein [Bacteroidaceae bacterium]